MINLRQKIKQEWHVFLCSPSFTTRINKKFLAKALGPPVALEPSCRNGVRKYDWRKKLR